MATEPQRQIDELLQRYLGLLDEYTALRAELSRLQADVFQNIARANFAAERGMRYGPDHYDERMSATRHVRIRENDAGLPVFDVGLPAPSSAQSRAAAVAASQGDESGMKEDARPGDMHREAVQSEVGEQEEPMPARQDPAHWFGLFVPMALRTAQGLSIKVVEEVIPRLASVHAEMLRVEIEVRRARKRRAKATVSDREQEGDVAQTGLSGKQTRREAVDVG
ncbi:hypothetical protein CDD83_581 [Cordyceps sp. RAO-2017]|nr:hypothetical protein CDD83_581 [Cordyceps sp. RAO-2017]